jgi:hypothetical protein
VAAVLGRLEGAADALILQRDQPAKGRVLLSFVRVRCLDGQIIGQRAETADAGQEASVARRALLGLWPPPAVPARQVESRPIYKRWWFWTTIGAAVVGGTVAAVLATADWKDTYTFRVQ